MNNVAIIIDSTTTIPEDLLEKYQISKVPVNLIIGDKVYLDGVDMAPVQYYAMLKNMKVLPTTSAPPAGTFLDVFRDAGKTTNQILCITISSKFSAVYDVVRQAKELADEELPDTNVQVFDSRTAAGATAFIVLEAARSAAAGKSMEQVIEVAEHIRSKVQLISILDTLEYLARGGRISKPAAWFGNLLNIKPMLQTRTEDGTASQLGRARSIKKGIEQLLSIMKERVGNKPVHVMVQHTNVPEEAEKLKEKVASAFNCVELYVNDYTLVMGTHTGPGLLAIAFYADD